MNFSNILSDTEDWIKDTFSQIAKKPAKLLYGQDPLSIGVKNAITGSDEKPLISMMGGPSEDTRDRLGMSSDSRKWYDAADTIAAIWGLGAFAGSSAGSSLASKGASLFKSAGSPSAGGGAGASSGGSNIMSLVSNVGSLTGGGSGQQASSEDDGDSALMKELRKSLATTQKSPIRLMGVQDTQEEN